MAIAGHNGLYKISIDSHLEDILHSSHDIREAIVYFGSAPNNLLWVAMVTVGHNGVPIVGGNRSFGGRQQWPSICIIPRYTIGLGNSLLRKHAQRSIVGDDGY